MSPQFFALLLLVVAAATAKPHTVSPLRVNGLITATFTPFLSNGTINVAAVEGQAKWLQATGVYGVFVSGTTGESVKLTFAERKSQAELWVKIGPKYGLKVIIHVGTESTFEAIELARHAQSIGADAIGAMPPVFFKPATVQALALTMSAIFAAAPDLPAYYYHIPSMTGVTFPMMDYVEAMEAVGAADNFCGVKYTGLYTYPGFMDVTRILNYKNGKYEVLGGREDMMLEALAAGLTGFVGSQFNYAGDLYNNIRAAWTSGNLTEVRSLQYDAVSVIAAWSVVPTGVNGNKNVMNVMKSGVAVGDGRLPGVPISPEDAAKLKDSMEAVCKRPGLADIKICQSRD